MVTHVHWWQDIFSHAALDRFSRGPARLVAKALEAMERTIVTDSRGVVAISDRFADVAEQWGRDPSTIDVIPNWAPLDEFERRPDPQRWRAERGIDERPVLMYAGTLGLKHNPSLLVDVASRVGESAQVVVLSEGLGAEELRRRAAADRVQNLTVLPFEPLESLHDALSAATVLMAVLDRAAGTYSVPSKVLTYLCVGRPILLSVPRNNPAAQMLLDAEAGVVVDPDDALAFTEGACRLLADPSACERHGECARAFARRTFDIGPIAARFESVFRRAARA